MKRSLVCAIFLLLISWAAPYVSHASPVIYFPETGHDFGTVGSSEKIEYFFEFFNRGDQDLDIGKVSGS